MMGKKPKKKKKGLKTKGGKTGFRGVLVPEKSKQTKNTKKKKKEVYFPRKQGASSIFSGVCGKEGD